MIDKTMFKWGMAVVIFATFVVEVSFPFMCMRIQLKPPINKEDKKQMSRVRIKIFHPDVNSNEVVARMNGFLDNPRIKYVDHTYGVITNPNVGDYIKEMRQYNKNLHFGSIAYYAKEEKSEKKEKKD